MKPHLLAATVLAAAFIAGCSDSSSSATHPTPSDPKTAQRLVDLDAVKTALERYRGDNSSYPVSQGFDGFPSQWGASTPDWIKGLAPKYIAKLPVDQDHEAAQPSQYLYKSDGKDYKLLAHATHDCEAVKKIAADLVDRQRDCWAYGYWTSGAASW